MNEFSNIETAIAAIRDGEVIVVVDDADRENEGDMILAAEKATPEKINFLARYARGLICTPITEQRALELELGPMVPENTCRLGTAFTVSIDLVGGCTTGISAHDPAATVRALVDPGARAVDFARPGHVFPLVANSGGVLKRPGHTEAAVDLARMAGLAPAGVLCEVLDEDGSMARLPRLREIAAQHNLKVVSIADLIAYRRRTEKLVEKVREIRFPSEYGEFRLHLYRSIFSGCNHIALTRGKITRDEPVLVRVHSQCFTGDVFGSLRCDCGPQLHRAMSMIDEAGSGVLLYMNQEGRGIGLENKIHAYALQDEGRDTVEANEELGFPPDLRDYGVSAQILKDLSVGKIRLLTNNPKKVVGLAAHGLQVVDREPLEIEANDVNRGYLAAKRDKMGHLLTQVLATPVAAKNGGIKHGK